MTVIGIKEGFVVRLDEYHLLVEHVDKCVDKLIASQTAKTPTAASKLASEADKERQELVNIAIRSLWPNRTHLGFKSLRGLLSTRLESKHVGRAVYHSKRFEILTGKSIPILPHIPTSTHSIVHLEHFMYNLTEYVEHVWRCRVPAKYKKLVINPKTKEEEESPLSFNQYFNAVDYLSKRVRNCTVVKLCLNAIFN